MPCFSAAILAIKTVFSLKIVRIQVNGLYVILRRPRLYGSHINMINFYSPVVLVKIRKKNLKYMFSLLRISPDI